MKHLIVGLIAFVAFSPLCASAEEAEVVSDVQPHVFDDLDGDGKSDRAAALQGFNPGQEGDAIEDEALPYPAEELAEEGTT